MNSHEMLVEVLVHVVVDVVPEADDQSRLDLVDPPLHQLHYICKGPKQSE